MGVVGLIPGRGTYDPTAKELEKKGLGNLLKVFSPKMEGLKVIGSIYSWAVPLGAKTETSFLKN